MGGGGCRSLNISLSFLVHSAPFFLLFVNPLSTQNKLMYFLTIQLRGHISLTAPSVARGCQEEAIGRILSV